MIDPQQDGLGRYFSVFEAVFFNLREIGSFDVEVKDGLCACEYFIYSDSFGSFWPVFPGSFPFHLSLVHHPFQIVFQIFPDCPRLFVPVHQFLVPRHEVSVELFISQDGSFEPRMVQHLLSRQPFLRISNEQPFNQIFEGCWKRLHPSLKLAPEHFQLAFSDHVVILIGDLRVLERRDSHKHQEQDNASCEHIHLFSLVQHFMDLRSHVAFRSSPGLQEVVVIVALRVPGEPKVCYFDIESPIE